MTNNGPDSALIVHLPAFPYGSPRQAPLPAALRDWPVASINYRWDRASTGLTPLDGTAPPAQWPTPVHDTAYAYSWLLDQLAPPGLRRRNIYVYGSYLGASLATSLALTECHTYSRFAVRGVVAYNGVYNWTMFLPEHPFHKRRRVKGTSALHASPPLAEGLRLEKLRESIDYLFRQPSDLFDPFASPSLFFHNPGLHVPQGFDAASSPVSDMVSRLTGQGTGEEPSEELKPPRKSHLVFPPRASTLKIPETLLLHDRHSAPPATKSRRTSRSHGHTFGMQALELVDLMRRSVEKIELRERAKWDDEISSLELEAQRRVQVADVDEADGFDLGQEGEQRVREWLEDRA